MSLRLAFLGACPYPVPQGSQIFMRDHALALQALGHEVCLVVYGYGVGDAPPGLEVVRSVRLPGDRKTGAGPSLVKPLLDLALVATLRRTLRERRIDAVIAHNYEALVVALAARTRPVIYHAHNALTDELPHYFRGAAWARQVGSLIDRQFPRRADAVIAPHARLARYLTAQGCEAARVHVVPPIADVAAFTPGQVHDAPAPILYTGNLDDYQNLDLLSRAFARLQQRDADARLLVATAEAGAAFPKAEICPTPDLAAVQAILAKDAVVAVPRVSWSGYPVKLLNAMAAGKACVACASAGWPITDGHDGLVVADNDATAFAAALGRLRNDPALRRRLGTNARATALETHGAAAVAKAIEAIVRGTLAA